MRLKKKIEKIDQDIESIKQILSSNIKEKANKYDDLIENLNNVSFKVSNITTELCENGNRRIKIEYSIPPVYLHYDENDEMIFNPTFYSINLLNLISLEDMKKISKIIKIKKKK